MTAETKLVIAALAIGAGALFYLSHVRKTRAAAIARAGGTANALAIAPDAIMGGVLTPGSKYAAPQMGDYVDPTQAIAQATTPTTVSSYPTRGYAPVGNPVSTAPLAAVSDTAPTDSATARLAVIQTLGTKSASMGLLPPSVTTGQPLYSANLARLSLGAGRL